jgi:hypothetical protein
MDRRCELAVTQRDHLLRETGSPRAVTQCGCAMLRGRLLAQMVAEEAHDGGLV